MVENLSEMLRIANENYRAWKELAEKEKDLEEAKRLFKKSIFWLETYTAALFLSNVEKNIALAKTEEEKREMKKLVEQGKAKLAARLLKYAETALSDLNKML